MIYYSVKIKYYPVTIYLIRHCHLPCKVKKNPCCNLGMILMKSTVII